MAEIQGKFFQDCDHRHKAVVPEKRSSVHFAKQICSDCKKFLKWIPKPETLHRRMLNAETLTSLSKRDDLDEWTRHFVRSVSSIKNLTPKQQGILDDLRKRFLESQ